MNERTREYWRLILKGYKPKMAALMAREIVAKREAMKAPAPARPEKEGG